MISTKSMQCCPPAICNMFYFYPKKKKNGRCMIDATINKSLRLMGAARFNSCASYYHNHYQNAEEVES